VPERGEHGIAINVPVKVKVGAPATVDEPRMNGTRDLRPEHDAAGRDDRDTRLVFKTGHVFDISQTDGQDLPELERQPIQEDSHEGTPGSWSSSRGRWGTASNGGTCRGGRAGGATTPQR
jgi:hypothetical protein